ncbi:MAG: PHP domain-containing protein, partial [Candidatus Dechloromonas phosphoritropha]
MTPPRFVHLRLHSEYSVTDGMVRIGDAVKRAAADGMPALALTDLGNLFGLVKFYTAARGKGLKPVAGADVWIANREAPDDVSRLLLLVRNRDGYRQLCELLSRAYLVDGRRDRAEIRREWFDEIGSDGLIALSGANRGDIGEALINGNFDQAGERAKAWEAIFPGAFYLEVQRYGQPQQESVVQQTADLAGELGLPLVATHPVQFMNRDDFRAHEARICIAEGYVLGDTRRPRLHTGEQYFKTQAEMAELFADLPEALENSLEIARRCNIELTLGKNFLPDFPTPAGMTLDDFLVAEARAGLEKRLVELFPDPEERLKRRPEYDERLAFECRTIIQMGYPGYFLIVADFINWAK